MDEDGMEEPGEGWDSGGEGVDKGDWCKLPDIILERVFTYLSRVDQVSASLVCRKWSDAFHHPNLWRKTVVDLQEANLDSLQRIVHFTKRHGHYLRHLTIDYHRTCRLSRRDLERQLSSLLDDLHARPQLTCFRFRNFLFKRDWRSPMLRNKLLNSLCRFVKTQRAMSEVDVTRLDANAHEGTRVLQSIVAETIRTLRLEDLFHSRQVLFRNDLYLRTMENFKHLEELATNYNCMSEEFLGCLADNNAGRLRTLSIKCRQNDVHYHVIGNETWLKVKKVCPDLRVHFTIEQINNLETLERMLPTQVPLRHINYWTGFVDEEDTLDPVNFLNHILTHFASTLEDMELDFEESVMMVDAVLEAFLPGLRLLKRLVVTACLPVAFVTHVCTLHTQRLINLKVLRVKLCGIRLEDMDSLQEIVQGFQQQLADDDLYFEATPEWHL